MGCVSLRRIKSKYREDPTEFSKLGTRVKIISGDSKTSVSRILKGWV
jgi:hypothetical protein